jgi:hypothetical protein
MFVIIDHDNMAASPCRHVFDFVRSAFYVVITGEMAKNFMYGFGSAEPIKKSVTE